MGRKRWGWIGRIRRAQDAHHRHWRKSCCAFVDAMRRAAFPEAVLIDRLTGVPLERPPLSKAFLAADAGDDDRFVLRKSDWFAANDIQLLSGMEATSLDAEARLVRTCDGQELAYDRLVLATGATPRRLAGTEGLSGVFELRHPQDASRLRAAAAKARSAVVIGGGYIGLEVAATLAIEKAVTVEAAPLFLPGWQTSRSRILRRSSQTCRPGDDRCDGDLDESDNGAVSGVTLEDGQRLETDMLVVGIGVVPEMALPPARVSRPATASWWMTAWKHRLPASMPSRTGRCGQQCARHSPHSPHIPRVRMNLSITPRTAPSAPPPPSAGRARRRISPLVLVGVRCAADSAGIMPATGVRCAMCRPGKREGGFSVWSYESDVLRAVEAVRDPAGYMLGKSCLEKGLSPTPEQAGDPAFDLKTFVAAK